MTLKGLQRKKEKLSCQLKELSQEPEAALPMATATTSCAASTETASTHKNMAESLSHSSSIHSTLMKIFRPKPNDAAESSTNFNPSFTSHQVQQKKLIKRSARKPCTITPPAVKSTKVSQCALPTSHKLDKPVTITLVSPNTYTLPKVKEKKQLRKECKMGCCTFSESDSSEQVKKKIYEAFPLL